MILKFGRECGYEFEEGNITRQVIHKGRAQCNL